MNKQVKSLPLPKEIDIFYPFITKYTYYNDNNKLVASYVKQDGKWIDRLAIDIALQDLEKSKKDLQKALEVNNASTNTIT